jgi:hypothetical protein
VVKTAQKGAGGMAQVAERLPSKHKTLSSNPSITKKNKNNNQKIPHKGNCRTQMSSLVNYTKCLRKNTSLTETFPEK